MGEQQGGRKLNDMLASIAPVSGLDKVVSTLVLGTAFYRLDAKQQWFDLLDAFLLLGGTAIDTARQYGESEAVIGEWMQSRGVRDQMVVITKCGHGDGQLPVHNFHGVVGQELETSLHHLRTDHVDVYMLHRDNPSLPVGEVIERLNAEIDARRVRALGASNWAYARVDEANKYAREQGAKAFAVVSNNLSLAVPTAPFYPGLVSVDEAGERWHQETGIPLMPWSAQARGFFTGRYAPELRGRAGSTGNGFTSRMIEVYGTDENLERLRRAQDLGQKRGGYSATQVALAWVLHKAFPVVPIVGPHTRAELQSCVEATSLELSDDDLKWLNLMD